MNKKKGLKMIYVWSQCGVYTGRGVEDFDPQRGQNSGNSIFAIGTKAVVPDVRLLLKGM